MTAPRRGISLSELLVVMTACSALLTLSSGLVCRLMRVHVDSRAYIDAQRNATRLGDNFRRDVHQARSVTRGRESGGDSNGIRFELSDGRQANYSWQRGIVLREESGADRPTARDEFELPATCDVIIEQLDAPPRIILTVSSDIQARLQDDPQASAVGKPVPVSLQVEATVGRDTRLTASAAVEDATE